MGWGAQQWLRCTKEATYGTFDASADADDITWFRLVADNSFTVRVAPQRQIIRSADGGNRRRQQVATRKIVAGGLNTLLYPTQAAYLLGAALTLTSNELASYTLDYYDTVQVHRFLGSKIDALTITSNAQTDYVPATVQWTCQSRGTTTLAQPADSVFPAEVPYTHAESKGLVSIGGTMSKYNGVTISIDNILSGTWDEDQWITALYYCGRDINLSINLQYLSATMRTNFESQAALAVSAAWARSGGLTTTLDLKAKDYIASVADSLPLGNAAYQQLEIQAFYDQSAGTDCSFTVA